MISTMASEEKNLISAMASEEKNLISTMASEESNLISTMADEERNLISTVASEEIENSLTYENFEKNLESVSTYIQNKKRLKTQYLEKSNECDRLKSSLNNACVEVKKFYSLLYDDSGQNCNLLLMNNSLRRFLKSLIHRLASAVQVEDATSAKSNSEELIEKIPIDSQSEDSNPCFEILLQDNFNIELLDNSQEKEKLKIRLDEANEECRRLKTQLQAANEKLSKTDELLDAEKSIRSKVEVERDSLTCLADKLRHVFLQHKHLLSTTDKMVVFSALTNGKPTTELYRMIECESGRDCVLESNPSTSTSIVNNELTANENGDINAVSSSSIENSRVSSADEIGNTDAVAVASSSINDSCSTVQKEASSAISTSLLESPKLDTSAEPCFKCDHCDKSFPRRMYLIKHYLKKHVDEQPSDRCKQNDQFITPKKPTLPNNTPPMKPKVRPQIAINRNFPQYKPKPRPRCDICQRNYCSKSSLSDHIRRMHGVRPFKCGKCNKSYVLLKELTRHKCVQTNAKKLISSNDTPAMKAEVRPKVVIHNSPKHRKRSVSGPRCNICNKHYANKSGLYEHIRIVHDGVKPYKCSKCNKMFSRRIDVIKHSSVHADRSSNDTPSTEAEVGPEFNGHRCDTCRLCFSDEKYLYNHKRYARCGVRPHKCSECDETFANKLELKAHSSEHSSKRALPCSICD